jgi:hypothetical protein
MAKGTLCWTQALKSYTLAGQVMNFNFICMTLESKMINLRQLATLPTEIAGAGACDRETLSN